MLLGVAEAATIAKERGHAVAPWVEEMISAGHNTFYRVVDGKRECYDPSSKSYKVIPGQEGRINLKYLGEDKVGLV